MNGTHGITICIMNENHHFVREKILVGHHQHVKTIMFHPVDDIMVSAGTEGVYIWDTQKQVLKKIIKSKFDMLIMNSDSTVQEANEGEVECICWLYNGTILAVGGRDSAIKLYDVAKEYSFFFLLTLVMLS